VHNRSTTVADIKSRKNTWNNNPRRWEKDNLLAYQFITNPIETPLKKEVARKPRRRIKFLKQEEVF
jgi:hypothetical protein